MPINQPNPAYTPRPVVVVTTATQGSLTTLGYMLAQPRPLARG